MRELPPAVLSGQTEDGAAVKLLSSPCTECGDTRGYACRGLCNRCYQKAKKNGMIKTVDLNFNRIDTSGERCRCGLRLPCFDCLPEHLHEFIEQRMQKPEGL